MTKISSKYFFIVFIILITSCSKRTTSFTQDEIETLFKSKNLGLAYIEESKLDKAINEFKTILKINPKEAMGYGNLALINFRLGDFEKAMILIKKAENINNKNPAIKLIKSEILLSKNQNEQAIKTLEETLKDNPKNIRVLFKLSELYGLLFQINNNKEYLISRSNYLGQILDLEYVNLAVKLQYIDSNLKMDNKGIAKLEFENLYQLLPALTQREVELADNIFNEIFNQNIKNALRYFIGFFNIMKTKNRYQADLDLIKSQGLTLVGFPIEDFLSQTFMLDNSKKNNYEIKFINSNNINLALQFDIINNFVIDDLDFDRINEVFVSGKYKNKFKSQILSINNYTDPLIIFEYLNSEKINHSTFKDLDNNGFLDLIIVTENETSVFYNNGELDFSEKFLISSGYKTNKLLFGDFDHDGDLDIFQLNKNKNIFLRNNSDRSFFDNSKNINLDIKNINTVDGDISDFDDDGDLDIILINLDGSIDLLSNERHGNFIYKTEDFQLESSLIAVQSEDINNDGLFDIIILLKNRIQVFENLGGWKFKLLKNILNDLTQNKINDMFIADFNNDSALDILISTSKEDMIFIAESVNGFIKSIISRSNDIKNVQAKILDYNLDGDLDLICLNTESIKIFDNTLNNINKFLNIKLTGLRVGSGKNNYFGIGSKIEIKSGDIYQTKIVKNSRTHFGLIQNKDVDVMRVVWTNGYPQNVINPDLNQEIIEKQELKGSCPYLYCWDGEKFDFVKDILWRNALGMPLGIMSSGYMKYAFHHSTDEYVKIPGEYLKPKDQNYILKISMELWETAYYDNIKLHVIDHPINSEIYVDEKFLPYKKLKKKIFTVKNKKYPITAYDGKGNDVLKYILKRDFNFISNLILSKYQGTTKKHDLIIDLGKIENPENIQLYLHGWLFPTDASLNVKISQEKTFSIKSPTIEVLDQNNNWITIDKNIFFPNGKDKTCIIDLSNKFLSNNYKIKISTSMAIYWDEVFFTENEESIAKVETVLSSNSTILEYRGYSKKYLKSNIQGLDYPSFYEVFEYPKWRDLRGSYTKYGEVNSLIMDSDNKYVIMNSGDVITIKFPLEDVPDLPYGWKRDYLLYSDGWLKDGDMNTLTGNSSNPLPFHDMKNFPSDSIKYFISEDFIEYNNFFNTRKINDNHFKNYIKEN